MYSPIHCGFPRATSLPSQKILVFRGALNFSITQVIRGSLSWTISNASSWSRVANWAMRKARRSTFARKRSNAWDVSRVIDPPTYLRAPLKTVLFRDGGVSLVLKSSCNRLHTAVFRARLPCPHKKCLVFRGALNFSITQVIRGWKSGNYLPPLPDRYKPLWGRELIVC